MRGGRSLPARLARLRPSLQAALSGAEVPTHCRWAYDILTLLAGLLPDPGVSTAATGIAYNVQTIVFTLPLGLSSAACTRVGHHLGAARPRAAKLAGTPTHAGASGACAAHAMLAPAHTLRRHAAHLSMPPALALQPSCLPPWAWWWPACPRYCCWPAGARLQRSSRGMQTSSKPATSSPGRWRQS